MTTPSVMFAVGSRLLNSATGCVCRVLATPATCAIEPGLVPAYACIGEDGSVVVQAQAAVEGGLWVAQSAKPAGYEDLLEMIGSGDGLEARQAEMGLNFLRVTPRAAWDTFVVSLAHSAEPPAALSRFLNQVQFEATELRTFFLKRRTF